MVQNYTKHIIQYESKKINQLIGMNYNKGVSSSTNTYLTQFLKLIQLEHENRIVLI